MINSMEAFDSTKNDLASDCRIPALAMTGSQNMLGGVPQHRGEMTRAARDHKKVPDKVAVAGPPQREESNARRVCQTAR